VSSLKRHINEARRIRAKESFQCLKATHPAKHLSKVILSNTIVCLWRTMNIMEIQSLLSQIREAVLNGQEKRKLVEFQQKLIEAIAAIDEGFASQWLSAKASADRVTDGYADMMAVAGTHGLREAVKRQFEVINNLLVL
jgi:hypothetical protein